MALIADSSNLAGTSNTLCGCSWTLPMTFGPAGVLALGQTVVPAVGRTEPHRPGRELLRPAESDDTPSHAAECATDFADERISAMCQRPGW